MLWIHSELGLLTVVRIRADLFLHATYLGKLGLNIEIRLKNVAMIPNKEHSGLRKKYGVREQKYFDLGKSRGLCRLYIFALQKRVWRKSTIFTRRIINPEHVLQIRKSAPCPALGTNPNCVLEVFSPRITCGRLVYCSVFTKQARCVTILALLQEIQEDET